MANGNGKKFKMVLFPIIIIIGVFGIFVLKELYFLKPQIKATSLNTPSAMPT